MVSFSWLPRLPRLSSVAAGLLLVAATGWTTLVPRMTLEQMAEESHRILHGTVVRVWSGWDAGRQVIWTHAAVRLHETLKGEPAEEIVVSEPGGEVGGMEMRVAGAPRFEPGEELVLFTTKTPIGYLRTCGWGQGKFIVQEEGGAKKVAGPVLRGVSLVAPSGKGRGAERQAASPLQSLDGLPLSEFKLRIRRLLERNQAQ